MVFDIGGVLLEWRPELVYLELLPDPEERAWFLGHVCTPEWNASLDAGRPFDEACQELAAEFPAYADAIHAWKRQDEMIAGEVPGTAGVVSRLEGLGVARFLLTNMPADVFTARVERYPVLRRFDGAVVSGEEGVCKPSPTIFRLLLARFGLEPAGTLFIDDAEVNVAAARGVGLRAHRFVDAPSLVRDLAANSIAVEID